jgi:hypothetical protein
MNDNPAKQTRPRFWLFAGLLLLPFMLTNDSIWIDEGNTAICKATSFLKK